MAVETLPRPQRRSILDHTLDLSRVNLELVAYVVVIALSVIAHLWGLGAMAMHHDESIHAWSSWRFYTGRGGFTCAGGGTSATYCYDPVYHGPSLYIFTLISFFLFGDGDAQARLPMALAGIGLVASCWMLRPYLGRSGALIAAVLLGFSPSLLYFTRFARHDALMVLWELWIVIGFFRYVDTGRPGYLYLLAASIALAIGTHELYYIVFFIFGLFLIVRLLAESRFANRLSLGLLVAIGVCAALIVFNLFIYRRPLPFGEGLYLGDKAFLAGSTLLLVWFAARVWDPRPVVLPRFQRLWQAERATLWIAVGILVGIYLVLYTTFFAYPRGAIDGLYAGLAYWLGSQHEFARGDQPWYYYLMLLPLYEPLAVLCSIGAAIYLFSRWRPRERTANEDGRTAIHPALEQGVQRTDNTGRPTGGVEQRMPYDEQDSAVADPPSGGVPLFPLFLVCWFFSAVVIFSWAGEKMPWLVVHMALPGNLLAAWTLGKLVRTANWRAVPKRQWLLAVPPLVLLLVIMIGVALWRLSPDEAGLAAQRNILQALFNLVLAGAFLFALLTLGVLTDRRVVFALASLTIACLLGAYMIRATWLAVYTHPDTPIELLVYTQTSPDVPRYVEDVREIAINLTRNYRTSEDVAGGLSMPIIIDSGDENGEGSLAWPLQWYLRDFQNVLWKRSNELSEEPSLQKFEVQLPDGSTGLAPVVMLHKSHITEGVRNVLREGYVPAYGDGGVFNWWFPEGDKCLPQPADADGTYGYKRFYFNSWMPKDAVTAPSPKGCGQDISAQLNPPWAPLVWPFDGRNWGTLWNFVVYRDLPEGLQPGAREMQVWLRQDLAGGVAATPPSSVSSATTLQLLADLAIGSAGELSNPTGIAIDRQGNAYVADTLNHRIQVFDAEGTFVRSIGSFGTGTDQFYEPRGVAVDARGNLYVADTWNARVVKLSPTGEWLKTWGVGEEQFDDRRFTDTGGTLEGNAAKPLGFYGPRGVAVDAQGQVYIADTGNKRIVVTDDEGNFRYQFGYAGAESGAFNEPTGVAVDRDGKIYVADTWNGRVQVFQPNPEGGVAPVPIVTWRVSGWDPNTYEDPSIAVGPDSQVYVSVPLQNRVLAANLRGDVALRWGGAGQDLAALNSPSGIAVDAEGKVYVVDRDRARVLRFTLPQVKIEATTDTAE